MKILIVDDESSQREILNDILEDAGFQVKLAASGEEGMEVLKNQEIFLILTDLKMPGMDGIQLLQKALHLNPDIQVILMTAFGSIPSAVNAIKNGAYDYLTKPFNKNDLLRLLQRASDKIRLIIENRQLKDQLLHNYGYHQLIGRSKSMQHVFHLIDKIKDVDSAVLITGESGTGKELVARAIHFGSRRKDSAFVALNCSAIPENLIESELFGYEKGAFTGAVRDHAGKFEQAQGGTIFLDEIGAMPFHLQPRLLRVLEEKKISKLGGKKNIHLNVRVISATNEDIQKNIKEHKFRIDLFHRLNIFEIQLPPLRERKEDIEILARHFLDKFVSRYDKKDVILTSAAIQELSRYDFPGNVRELENIIEKTILLGEDNRITPESLVFSGKIDSMKLDRNEAETLPQMEREMIKNALQMANGSIKKASAHLGITYKTLQYRMKKFKIDKKAYKV
ncbi:MAG: sigma-54-dependent Fis family transcriptional regulator [bacterium]|nr:MAG: sigma-54-dependent Fis family transcriptional regulator [bacterium]